MVSSSGYIVVVDDDERLRNRLAAYLGSEGFRVRCAGDGAEMRRLLAEEPPDLVILDLMMPGEDGLSLTRFVRDAYGSGIIILTGKGEAVDRIVGLEVGADDYVAKPFELRELLARVRSVLRRLSAAPKALDEPNSADRGILCFEGWKVHPGARRLEAPDGSEVHLTNAEYRLLLAFVSSPGRVLDRDQLLDAAGEREWQPYDRSVDLHISHLRKKIETDPGKPRLIKTVRGAGYTFTPQVTRREG